MLKMVGNNILNTDDISVIRPQFRKDYERPDTLVKDDHWCILLITTGKEQNQDYQGNRQLYLDSLSYDTEQECITAINDLFTYLNTP